jgi:hypothetical protein
MAAGPALRPMIDRRHRRRLHRQRRGDRRRRMSRRIQPAARARQDKAKDRDDTWPIPLGEPISDSSTLRFLSEELLAAQFPMRKGVRLIGLSLPSLCAEVAKVDKQMALRL